MKINIQYNEETNPYETLLFRYPFNDKEVHYFHISALEGVDYE